MAKDALGHGSDTRGGSGGFSADQAANLREVLNSKYTDGAHPSGGAPSDAHAAAALSTGTSKSAAAPVHDAQAELYRESNPFTSGLSETHNWGAKGITSSKYRAPAD
jgi:hypothetical protein